MKPYISGVLSDETFEVLIPTDNFPVEDYVIYHEENPDYTILDTITFNDIEYFIVKTGGQENPSYYVGKFRKYYRENGIMTDFFDVIFGVNLEKNNIRNIVIPEQEIGKVIKKEMLDYLYDVIGINLISNEDINQIIMKNRKDLEEIFNDYHHGIIRK